MYETGDARGEQRSMNILNSATPEVKAPGIAAEVADDEIARQEKRINFIVECLKLRVHGLAKADVVNGSSHGATDLFAACGRWDLEDAVFRLYKAEKASIVAASGLEVRS